MKKKYLYWGLIVVFLLLLALPKISWQSEDAQASTSSQSQAINAEALIISKSELSENLILNATLMGDEEIELRAEVPGKVIQINFSEGTRVKKDDLLVKINDADLQAQLVRAKSQLKLAEEKEYRSKQLIERNLISQEEYDILLNDLNSRKAEIELLKAQIDKTEIKAPFDGVVGLRSISEGSYITSAVNIAILTKTNPIKVDFALPIKHADKVRVGTKINLIVPNSSKKFNAQVYAIDPKVDVSTRTIKIRAKADNENGTLIPGSYAEVEIQVDKDKEGVLVPTQSIVPDISGELVYLYKRGKAVPTNVKIGLRTNTDVQIIDGLNEGDTVITSAIIQMRPGADVSIKNFR
ncbi:MAG: efflux RND transporter periplasmic adaptor subunit [Melioribacteraceae bacterium]|nr:efflux RND transporter periplasmic adaptor subunit [Melioribacteraceae bacterium]